MSRGSTRLWPASPCSSSARERSSPGLAGLDQNMSDARGTVLIVDDDPVSIEVLGDYLTRKQLGVVRAHTVDQALAELDSERPEVAVVGVRLGDTGELEAIKRIRQGNVHVPLVPTPTPRDG